MEYQIPLDYYFCSTLPSHCSTFGRDGFIQITTSCQQITTSHSNLLSNGGNLYERSGNLYEGSGTIKTLRNIIIHSAPTGNRTGASPVEGQRGSMRLRRQAYQNAFKTRFCR